MIRNLVTSSLRIELKNLVGEHWFDAIDHNGEQLRFEENDYEDSSVVRFRLDGTVYIAIEDPSDGYRSTMRCLLAGNFDISNTFKPIRVIAKHRTHSESGECDLLELIDVRNGETIFTVGTDRTSDYYPSFVAWFVPKNIAQP